jgi:hypothetical protein
MKLCKSRLLICIGALIWTTAWSGDESLSINSMEGVYYFVLSDNSKETLSIIKLSPTTAYFELQTAYAFISGVADKQTDGLLYQEDRPQVATERELEDHSVVPMFAAREHYWCKLGIHFGTTKITVTDPIDPVDAKDGLHYPKGTCGLLYSGAKGGFAGHEFKTTTRRKLTANKIVMMFRSEDFYNAMTWREMFLQGKTPEAQ